MSHLPADPKILPAAALGSRAYLAALQAAAPAEADRLMRPLLKALVEFQQRVPADALPPLDEALLASELALFPQWCVERESGVTWTPSQRAVWDRICAILIQHLLAQAQVAVHGARVPLHPMLRDEAGPEGGDLDRADDPGVPDHRDAMRGPVALDLASLLSDALLSSDEAREIDWTVRWWDDARRAGLPVPADFGDVWRDVEWTGLYRHLTLAGLRCRLKHREGMAHGADDLQRHFSYITRVANRYRPLRPLLALMEPLSGARVGAGFTF